MKKITVTTEITVPDTWGVKPDGSALITPDGHEAGLENLELLYAIGNNNHWLTPFDVGGEIVRYRFDDNTATAGLDLPDEVVKQRVLYNRETGEVLRMTEVNK